MDDSFERLWMKLKKQKNNTHKTINCEKIKWLTSEVKNLLEDYATDNEASCDMTVDFEKIEFIIIGNSFEILGFEKYLKEIINMSDSVNITSSSQQQVILQIRFVTW